MKLRILLVAAVFAVAGAALAATTGAYNTGANPNIRGSDSRLVPSKLSTFPQLGEITASDGTGFTLTTPTAAVIKDASLTLAGAVRGSVVVDGPNGTLTVKQPGLYRVCFGATAGTGANTGTQTITVFKNVNGGGAAEMAPAIKAIAITLTAQPWIPLSQCGNVEVTADQAKSAAFVVFDARATSSTGDMVIKQWRFSATKIDENDPPAP